MVEPFSSPLTSSEQSSGNQGRTTSYRVETGCSVITERASLLICTLCIHFIYVAHGQALFLKVLHIPCLWEAFPNTLEPCSGLPSVTACISPLSFCYCCSHYLSSCCVINSKAAHPVSILLTILSVEHEKTFCCEEGGRESHSGFGVPDPSWLCREGPHYSPSFILF